MAPDRREPRPTPSPRLADRTSYQVPRAAAPIDLRLDANEGPPPPAALFDRLAAEGPELLRRYPDAARLEQLLADRYGLHPSQVLATAGGDDALFRACLAMLAPGREMILPTPTFEMLARYGRLAGADLATLPWPEGPFPTDAVLERIRPQTALIAVVSPNNPTGCVATAADLRKLSNAAPHALLLVDLAYTEFADTDLTPVALSLPNAIVVRSMSKAWGLAGLRVGYALGPAELIGWLRATGNPYALSAPAAAAAMTRLSADSALVAAYVDRVRAERVELTFLLAGLGTRPIPSQANFVLARYRDPLWVRDGLAGLGIAVRTFPDRPDLADCVRITCPGNEDDFARLSRSLTAVLAPATVTICPSAQAYVNNMVNANNRGRRWPRLTFATPAPSAAPGWALSAQAADLRTARSIGLVPLGLRITGQPGEDPAALTAAGAARILTDPSQLQELLSCPNATPK